jgi:HD-like signal output (HDOD) protein
MADISPNPGRAESAVAVQRRGRFELKRLVGESGYSQTWRAIDPMLQREVIVSWPKPLPGQTASMLVGRLQVARQLERLHHPHIMAILEIETEGANPCSVAPYVSGKTLAQLLLADGALPGPRAAAVVMDVLSALVAALAAGEVHGDLNPSQIWIEADGHVRVMNFGMAPRRAAAVNQPAAEVKGNQAAAEAKSGLSQQTLDLYCAGLLLAEMLLGERLPQRSTAYQAAQQRPFEVLHLPVGALASLPAGLRDILVRMTLQTNQSGFASSMDCLKAVTDWREHGQSTPPAAGEQSAPADTVLATLLQQMRGKSDFPALSESVLKIQRMATSETESISSITNEILKDVALTNKLLRLVNSAHYAQSGSISTVSRAVKLVGLHGIRNMAFSLSLLDNMHDKANAHLLREEFLRSLMAGTVAAELATTSAEGEEAFVGALFQNLGRMLTQYYFPSEAASIRALRAAHPNMRESAAVQQVLGIDFENFGLGAARAWGLPENLQRCMQMPEGDPPHRPVVDQASKLRWIGRTANEMADLVLRTEPQHLDAQLELATKRFGKALGMSSGQMEASLSIARKKMADMADAMALTVNPLAPAARLISPPPVLAPELDQSQSVAEPDTLIAAELVAVPAEPEPEPTEPAPDPAPATEPSPVDTRSQMLATLTAGIQEVTDAMVEDVKLSDVLRMILETIYRGLDCQRVVFCMRDAKIDTLIGRFGLGAGVEQVVKTFRVPLHPSTTPDLFSTICSRAADTLIRDSRELRINKRLPAWYPTAFNAATFLVLPLLIKGQCVGLIYADKSEPESLFLDEKALALLRTLRNQAVMAFKLMP